MKKLMITCVIAVLSLTAFSQYVVVLHSVDTTAAFTGSTSLSAAYNMASDGDTLYLSGGAFSITNIAKQLYIFGAGIHPDSSAATQTTRILTNVGLMPGADSSRFEGIVFEGSLSKHQSYVIHDLMFSRCHFSNIDFGASGTPSVNSENYHFTECVILGSLDLQGVVQSTISNCIFQGRIYNSLLNDISNNAFLYQAGYYTYLINSSSTTNFRNNVFHSTESYIDNGSSNMYYNNLFVHAAPNLGTGPTEITNYKNVPLDDFYLTVPPTTFGFSDDYHPEPLAITNYPGTDGGQIGIFGGLFPVKEAFIPKNPHIISKFIEHNTNETGNLPVEVDVDAQDE